MRVWGRLWNVENRCLSKNRSRNRFPRFHPFYAAFGRAEKRISWTNSRENSRRNIRRSNSAKNAHCEKCIPPCIGLTRTTQQSKEPPLRRRTPNLNTRNMQLENGRPSRDSRTKRALLSRPKLTTCIGRNSLPSFQLPPPLLARF